MKNDTNLIKYRFLAPIYDFIFSPILTKARKKAFGLLDFKSKDKILLIGVGTGLDFPLIPKECLITGIDLSEAMLKKARLRAKNRNVKLQNMNAESLEFIDKTFDFVVLNLILSVAEDPKKVFVEAIRVLNDNGRILIFDKFIKGKEAGLIRKLLNKLTSFVGTDITRCFEVIITDLSVSVEKSYDSIFRGNYRILLLKKPDSL